MSGGKTFSSSVIRTSNPDIVTWYDGSDIERAEMPCGHAIGAESLTAYCKQLIAKGKYEITCPHSDGIKVCGQVWDYPAVRRIAVLSEEEKREFEQNISRNFIRKNEEIKACPSCDHFCSRKNKTNIRIICLYCSKGLKQYEFCWKCSGEWKTSGTTDCGNPSCSVDNTLKVLKEAPLKEIIGLENCPSIRACPSCGMLIEHRSDCKHMACPECGKGFCFICLKEADNNGFYGCGSYNSPCSIAPIQDDTPKTQKEVDNNGSNGCTANDSYSNINQMLEDIPESPNEADNDDSYHIDSNNFSLGIPSIQDFTPGIQREASGNGSYRSSSYESHASIPSIQDFTPGSQREASGNGSYRGSSYESHASIPSIQDFTPGNQREASGNGSYRSSSYESHASIPSIQDFTPGSQREASDNSSYRSSSYESHASIPQIRFSPRNRRELDGNGSYESSRHHSHRTNASTQGNAPQSPSKHTTKRCVIQ